MEVAKDTKFLYGIGLGTVVAGMGALLTKWLFGISSADVELLRKINRLFSGAMSHKDLVYSVDRVLKDYGYGASSLLATSLPGDELARPLESSLAAIYGDGYSLGGLAGFPFGGVTAFRSMASHIPDGGSCLIVFASQVGIDSEGTVGTVERRGKAAGGPACTASTLAAQYVADVLADRIPKASTPWECSDAQQVFVGNLLLPYAARLEKAPEKAVELPFAVYDAQKNLMDCIVVEGCGAVAGKGKIAVLGGIQIHTPPGRTDYFLPLSFELFDNKGKLLRDLLPSI